MLFVVFVVGEGFGRAVADILDTRWGNLLVLDDLVQTHLDVAVRRRRHARPDGRRATAARIACLDVAGRRPALALFAARVRASRCRDDRRAPRSTERRPGAAARRRSPRRRSPPALAHRLRERLEVLRRGARGEPRRPRARPGITEPGRPERLGQDDAHEPARRPARARPRGGSRARASAPDRPEELFRLSATARSSTPSRAASAATTSSELYLRLHGLRGGRRRRAGRRSRSSGWA